MNILCFQSSNNITTFIIKITIASILLFLLSDNGDLKPIQSAMALSVIPIPISLSALRPIASSTEAPHSTYQHSQRIMYYRNNLLETISSNRNCFKRSDSCLFMSSDNGGNKNSNKNSNNNNNNNKDNERRKKKNKRRNDDNFESYDGIKNNQNTTMSIQKKQKRKNKPYNKSINSAKKSQQLANVDNNITNIKNDQEMLKRRLKQLECLVSNQTVEIRKLRQECQDLKEAASAFAQVVELLREAGLTTTDSKMNENRKTKGKTNEDDSKIYPSTSSEMTTPQNSENKKKKTPASSSKPMSALDNQRAYEYFDDAEIFGSAPSSVIDAADSAGAAILAAMLGGKLRMLVDVRDAELSRDNDILVQFIELAILPVAAGLEGLTSDRKHRVKIVFPTVSKLLHYRRSMALSAPEVVALSTLGFDCVEDTDNLVVVIAPRPDDEEGMAHLSQLLNPKNVEDQLRQPVVVVNYHMLPLLDLGVNFTKVYHLRLLSVQYMTGDMDPEYVQNLAAAAASEEKAALESTMDELVDDEDTIDPLLSGESDLDDKNSTLNSDEDAALEAAMEHAHQIGVAQGITRAMVIRAYPK